MKEFERGGAVWRGHHSAFSCSYWLRAQYREVIGRAYAVGRNCFISEFGRPNQNSHRNPSEAILSTLLPRKDHTSSPRALITLKLILPPHLMNHPYPEPSYIPPRVPSFPCSAPVHLLIIPKGFPFFRSFLFYLSHTLSRSLYLPLCHYLALCPFPLAREGSLPKGCCYFGVKGYLIRPVLGGRRGLGVRSVVLKSGFLRQLELTDSLSRVLPKEMKRV